MPELDDTIERIRANLTAKNAARETGLRLSREVIRNSANAIRATHRGELDRADDLIAAAGRALAEARQALAGHQDVRHAGFLHDAEKEFAEASITRRLIGGAGDLPDPDDLEVGYAAYLNGLGEAVGELRRHLLDGLRRGPAGEREEALLQMMDDIYGALVTIDFPDAITGGLRRTTDVVRGILEKTRGDLTLSLRQQALESTLRDLESRFGGP
ncbi:MAG TPA: haloacid dehalogenase [Dehalococcoidia bacterium]|nr:haloacid dehalogenase [Dehalococcoidia bacterium]